MENVDQLIEEHSVRLAGSSTIDKSGGFEILAITAGEGNGWQFSDGILQESVALWDNAQVFIDHAWFSRSLRDLAGVVYSSRWDEGQRGVLSRLKPIGPSAQLLVELGQQLLSETGPKPNVGFSADVVFTTHGKKVQKILRVNSVDLVFAPARGGAFVRALNQLAGQNPLYRQMAKSLEGDLDMEKEIEKVAAQPDPLEDAKVQAEKLSKKQEALNDQAEHEAQAQKILAAQCGHLLDTALAASKLPAPAAERVRAQFTGKVFDPDDLDTAIADSRELVGQLTSSSAIQGPGGVHAMFNSEDKITAAVYDMLGAERPEELKKLRTERLSGIREFYGLATADFGFDGSYHPERAQFSVSADLPNVLKNALNKLILMQWEELGRAGYRWWESVVDVQHFNTLHDITGVLVGEVTILPAVTEGNAYTELGVADTGETGTWAKYGGYIGLSLEMFEKDQTAKLREYPKKLASSSLRRISGLVSACFTANAGVGPEMADTHNVFDAVNHANLGTTALSGTAWEAACKAVYSQAMLVGAGGTAPKLAIDPKYLLVPRDLRLTAMRILYPSFEREATIFSENMQKGQPGDVITVPEWTDANDWAAVVDPRLIPGIVIGERFGLLPEIFIADNALSGAFFTNDELRIKVRHFVSVFVADYRPLYKANVA